MPNFSICGGQIPCFIVPLSSLNPALSCRFFCEADAEFACLLSLQEIVFIGAGMDEAAIGKQLDGALVTDEEFERYATKWGVNAAPK